VGLGSVEGVMKENNDRKWRSKPFSKGLKTPPNRAFSTREAKMCCQCGAVTVIGGDALRRSKTLERFFCDIECAGEFKKWHNKTVTYKAKVESNEWVQQRKLRGEEARFKLAAEAAERLEFRKKMAETKRKLRFKCCGWCFKAFEGRQGVGFCSHKCSMQRLCLHRKQNPRLCKMFTVKCERCGEVSSKRLTNARFCSEVCRKKASKRNREHTKRSRSVYGECISMEKLMRKHARKCAVCGIRCTKPKGLNEPTEANVDHIIPLAKGGLHIESNVQLLCRSCNMEKSDKLAAGMQLMLQLS
jgi:hypothetical protein